MKPTLFFLDGVAPTPDSLVLAAQYNAHADVDASRVLLKFSDGWSKVDFDEDLIRIQADAWNSRCCAAPTWSAPRSSRAQ